MTQYINKAALVAAIISFISDEEESIKCFEHRKNVCELTRYNARIDLLNYILSSLDKIEAKEVDFDALGILAEHLIACEAHGVAPKYSDREIDMLEKLKNNNAQKGE